MEDKFTFIWCCENETEAITQYDFFVSKIKKIIAKKEDKGEIAYYYLLLTWLTLKKLSRNSFLDTEAEYNTKLIAKCGSFLSDFNNNGYCPEGEIMEYCYNFISLPDRSKYEIVDFLKNIPFIDDSKRVVLTNYGIKELLHTVLGGYIEYYTIKIKSPDTKEGIYDLMFFHQYIDSLKDIQECETLFMKKLYWLDKIACAFINGIGVGQNTTEGIRLLHQSIIAEKCYICRFSPLHLAMIYHYELDGYFDKDLALQWYEEAEEEADLCEDNDMLSFVQYQMNLINNSTSNIPDFSAVVNYMDTYDEPIRNCRYYIAVQELSGQVKVGDKIFIKIGEDKLSATIKGISLFDLLVDNVIVENTYVDLLLSFEKEEDEKIMNAYIMADDDSIDYYKEIMIDKI